MAFSLFQKKGQQLVADGTESTEQFEYLSPIQSKSKVRRITILGSTLTAVGILSAYTLGTMNVLNPPAQAVTYKRRSEVLGKRATTDISSGQVLLSSNTAASLPGAGQGQEILGLLLPSSNLPVRPLKAGDRVILTPTNAGVNSDSSNVESAVTGTIDTVTTVNGDTKIDVVLPQGTSKRSAFMDAVAQKKVIVSIEGAA